MPPVHATGLGKEQSTSMDDLAKRLDHLKEMLRALIGKVGDMDMQQQGLGVPRETCVGHGRQQLHVACARREANSSVPRQPLRAGLPPRYRYDAEEDQEDDDFLPTYHKLDFPKYDGASDPLPWLNHRDHNFCARRTPDHKRVICFVPPPGRCVDLVPSHGAQQRCSSLAGIRATRQHAHRATNDRHAAR
jgi:hypothetical protein